MPAPLLPTNDLDYTGLDREAMLARLQKLFNQVNEGYDDFSPNFPENLLLEGTVMLVDTARAVMEQRVRQMFWATVTERRACIRKGRATGLSLGGRSPSTVLARFTAPDPATVAKEITVQEGFRARTEDPDSPFRYRTTAAVTKAIGDAYVDVVMEHAEAYSESVASSGFANQELVLPQAPYIDGSAVITDSGGTFEAVSSFLGVKLDGTPVDASSRVCVLTQDDKERLVVVFGDGVAGIIPQGTITITYKTGGGASGAVDAGVGWLAEDVLFDSHGSPVTLIISNPAKATPGTDSLSVAEARVLGPLSARTTKRCVNEDDYEYAARLVPGIARAALINTDRDSNVQENHANLLLVAYGAQLDSGYYEPASNAATKIAEVEAIIAKTGSLPTMMGFAVNVDSAIFSPVDIDVRVYKTYGYTGSQVRTSILATLRDFFAVAGPDRTPTTTVDFGYAMRDASGASANLIDWSTIFGAVLASPGVRSIPATDDCLLLNSLRASVAIAASRFPSLGTVRIFDMDAGGAEITS